MTDRQKTYWVILAAGMALRILWGLLVPVEPVSDSWAYHQFARTIVDHGVYGWTADKPSAYWAVGTSGLAALTYLVTDGFAGIVVLNLIAGLMILTLTHHLAARWFGDRVAIWALALVAFWPNLIIFTSILSSELFFIALTLGGLFFWQRPRGHHMVNLLLAGLVWGAAAYIRPVILLVPVTLALVDLARGLRPFGITALQAAIAVLVILLVAMPWTMRNDRVMGAPVMMSTNFGPNFWMGNHAGSHGGYTSLPPEVATMTEIERADYLKAQALSYIRENPGDALRLLGRKMVQLHNRETIGVVWNPALPRMIGDTGVQAAKAVATGYWFLMLAGGLAGIVVLARRRGIIAALFNPPVALWGYFTAIHVIVVAEDRYHMPSSALIAVMAAVTLAALTSKEREL
ncbi:glycosyltransferase family 39 protein [Paracoccus sp. (in: a-proteobacteria)]|uniref:ArnT family glycosyltransferase n=1 Tax=Paracoccus sp. TaxID=267 RepID=UPI0026DFFB4C|nr:hypothetical protein [Paracoccus sp. (in: a-proteobacteria)]MDO5647462.1 hypothetical protein [Paracoccus sp. (in: a-proteobacteria)]